MKKNEKNNTYIFIYVSTLHDASDGVREPAKMSTRYYYTKGTHFTYRARDHDFRDFIPFSFRRPAS